jgi:branched-chain amino acid transport system substrate-binding protein
MISGSNTSSVLTSALQGNANEGWNPGFYRTSHNEVLEGTAAARFAFENLSASTAAVIVGGDPQSEGVGASFANSFQELGGEVTAFTRFAPTDTDMTPLLTELAASQPEVVYLSGPPSGGAFVAQQFASVPGLEATELIGSQGLLVGDYLSVPQTQGTYLSGPSLDLGTNSRTNVSFADLNDRYEETFGEPPTTAFSAHSYDATVLLLAAIEAVALEGPGGAQWVDRQQLRDQLNATAGFTGMTGSIACDEFGDCGSQAIAVYRHEDSSASDLIASVNIVAQFNPDDGLG